MENIGSNRVSFQTFNEEKVKNISKMIGEADYNSAVDILIYLYLYPFLII